MIRGFTQGSIGAAEFERRFLEIATADPGNRTASEYSALQELLGIVDAYVDDPVLRSATSDGIGEEKMASLHCERCALSRPETANGATTVRGAHRHNVVHVAGQYIADVRH